MSLATAKRFFDTSGIEPTEGGFAVTLDGRQIKTQGGVPLILPQQGLAAAVAAEWDAQEKNIRPDTMPITGLCCTTLDTVTSARQSIIDQLVKYGEHDQLCYRTDEPEDLAIQQQAQWQPLLDWAAETLGVRLNVTVGILSVDQPGEALVNLRRAVEALDDFHLTALASITQAAGSLIVGLAVIGGRLDFQSAFDLSQLEETWQASKWGEDLEAAGRRAALLGEIHGAVRFLDLVRGEDRS
ncbi:MAG: ATPase [Rhodospirillales bacterium]|nr:ATPase [Rhodospirillales bacterium]